MSRFLPLSESQLSSLPVEGLPSIVEQSSCASIVAGHFQASVEAPFSVATLSTAIRAEGNREEQARLNVLHGSFRNPIWQLWVGRGVEVPTQQADKIFAGLVFWEWHRRNPGQASPRLLASFEGTHLFRSVQSQNDVSASAQAEAKASFFVVSASTSASGSIDQKATLALRDYILMMTRSGDDRPVAEFVALPDPATIATEIGKVYLPVSHDLEGNKVEGTLAKTFHVLFPRLPAGFCSNSLWKISEAAGPPVNSYTFVQPAMLIDADGESAACRFTVQFRPNSNNSIVDTIAPALVSVGAVAQAEGTEVRIRIPFAAGLTRSPVPGIQFETAATYSVAPAIGFNQPTQVSTRYSFLVRGVADYGANPTVNTDQLTLRCPSGFGGAHPALAGSLQGSGANRSLIITGNGIHNGLLEANGPIQQCTLSGVLELRREGANYGLPVPLPDTSVPYPQPAFAPVKSIR